VNGLNQFLTAGPASFTYDLNGNLTSDGGASFTYDEENRLVAASGARTAALTYDPLGRLYETSGGSAGVTRFLYDGDELVAEYNGTCLPFPNASAGGCGTLLRRYVHGASVDDPLVWYEGATVSAASRRHLYADQQSSITTLSDANGVPLAGTIERHDHRGACQSAGLQPRLLCCPAAHRPFGARHHCSHS